MIISGQSDIVGGMFDRVPNPEEQFSDEPTPVHARLEVDSINHTAASAMNSLEMSTIKSMTRLIETHDLTVELSLEVPLPWQEKYDEAEADISRISVEISDNNMGDEVVGQLQITSDFELNFELSQNQDAEGLARTLEDGVIEDEWQPPANEIHPGQHYYYRRNERSLDSETLLTLAQLIRYYQYQPTEPNQNMTALLRGFFEKVRREISFSSRPSVVSYGNIPQHELKIKLVNINTPQDVWRPDMSLAFEMTDDGLSYTYYADANVQWPILSIAAENGQIIYDSINEDGDLARLLIATQLTHAVLARILDEF